MELIASTLLSWWIPVFMVSYVVLYGIGEDKAKGLVLLFFIIFFKILECESGILGRWRRSCK